MLVCTFSLRNISYTYFHRNDRIPSYDLCLLVFTLDLYHWLFECPIKSYLQWFQYLIYLHSSVLPTLHLMLCLKTPYSLVPLFEYSFFNNKYIHHTLLTFQLPFLIHLAESITFYPYTTLVINLFASWSWWVNVFNIRSLILEPKPYL